jgi:spore germination protein GerM
MKSIEKGPDETVNVRFYPSLISKAKLVFSNRNAYLNYLRKLTQDQVIGFLIGIAVGVNLVLLLQMSEDIISKLSETLTSSIIGIVAVLSSIAMGITIIYTQKKTNRRIRTLIEQQPKTVEDEGS